jgi:curved DNA-binding protein CbpA
MFLPTASSAIVAPMLQLVDFYRVLQVDPGADTEAIRSAYRTLARRYHPDRPGGSHARMVMLNQAWSVLGDAAARRVYDRSRNVIAPAAHPRPAPAPTWTPDPGRPVGSPSGTILDFGRYAGWSFGQIARHDPDFLEWLVRTPIGRPYRAEIESLLGQPARSATATATAEPARRRRFGRR